MLILSAIKIPRIAGTLRAVRTGSPAAEDASALEILYFKGDISRTLKVLGLNFHLSPGSLSATDK